MWPPAGAWLLALAGLALGAARLGAEAANHPININDQLPELVAKHPDKNWLIKFYAPWCYHCQQLEVTFNNAAERFYTKHRDDNLVIGRVDCTKSGRVCAKYGVDSYPTIVHINNELSIKYKGDRSEASIVAFAERLQGPDVNSVRDCGHLREAADKHGLVVLSNINNASNEVRREFESLAREHKSNHWFYHHIGVCENFTHHEGLYLLKRHLEKPIKFEWAAEQRSGQEQADAASSLRRAIVDWINRESFAVYGQITYRNFERALNSGRLLVLALLDHYKPARRFVDSSRDFHANFERLARRQAQRDDGLLFGWLSDLELIEYITMSPVRTPNVILLRANLSYHLLVDQPPATAAAADGPNDAGVNDKRAQERLRERNIRSAISRAKAGKLEFVGGNNYLYMVVRYVVGNLNKFLAMYRANPLLLSLLFCFPSLMIMFVIYTTCIRDGRGREDEEDEAEFSDGDEADDDERRRLLRNGHVKQD